MLSAIKSIPRPIQNTIANFAGLISTAGLTLLFSIFYYRILGSENFGLVSFCATILLLGSLFVDLGLGRAVTREIARREHDPTLTQEIRDVLFTLQILNFVLAIVCGVIVIASSSWLASHWLKLETVELSVAVQAISLLGVVAILQLPRELCRAALTGLQRQVLSNLLSTGFSALRGFATIAALLWIAPTPLMFLIVQVFVSILETCTLLIVVWMCMPKKTRRPHLEMRVIRDIWFFAMGDGLAALLGIGIYLGDRILLSRILPLDVFGNYSLAILITEVILRIVTPFSSAYYPHFSDLIAQNLQKQLSEEYHRIGVVLSAVVMPAAFILIFFASQILFLMTAQAAIAASFASLLALRALGNLVIGLQYLPHTLQLAAGVSITPLYLNAVNICIYLPGILYFTPTYGFLVPAIIWLAIVAVQTPTMIFVTHRVALQGERWAWVKEALLKPALISVSIVGAGAYFTPKQVSWLVALPWFLAIYAVVAASILLISNRTRPMVLELSHRFWDHISKHKVA